MNPLKVDVAIIGAGSAGMSAYKAARKHTDRVVVIEQGPYGTTCARVGCMPSKLLIAAADHAHTVATGEPFGVTVAGLKIDGAAVMARVRRERDRFVGFVLDTVDGWPAAHKLSGAARFEAPGRLRVADTCVEAARVIIATGATPAVPAGWRERLGDRLVVNDDVFEWDDLPNSVAVFGPGVIGLELGEALHRLGVQVIMFGMGGLVGPLTDEAIRDYAAKTLNEEFYLDADAKVEQMFRDGEIGRAHV